MHEVGVVRLSPASYRNNRHVKVDDYVHLGHIKASCEHVCRYENRKLLLSELVYYRVAYVVFHSSYQDLSLNVNFFQFFFKDYCYFLLIDEDHCHGSRHVSENTSDEFQFIVRS